MIGSGIKSIPSYKCDIPYDQLQELRDKFWASKKRDRRYWKVIKECCETDAETAVMLLEAAEMACVEGDLRQVMCLFNPDFIFRTPNFCVCDPKFERDYDNLKEKIEQEETKEIKIILYYLLKNKNYSFKVTNKTLVKKLKEKFAKKINVTLETHKIRLLYRGLELLDENPLSMNNIDEGSKIQVMVNQIN